MLLTWQPIDQISSVLWLLLSHCTVKAMRHHLRLLNDTQISTSASSGENTAHHSSSLGTAEILSAFCNNELTTHYLSNVTLNVLKVRSFTSSIFSVIIELTKIAYRPQWIPVIIFLFIYFFYLYGIWRKLWAWADFSNKQMTTVNEVSKFYSHSF